MRDKHLYLNQQSSEFSFYAKPPQREQYSGISAKGADKRETLIVTEGEDDVHVPYLSSGGWLNIITFKPGLAGHREVTRKVLSERFGFVIAAQDAVAVGAVDPDFYAWTVDAAHAQTAANDFGDIAQTDANGKVSRSAFIRWLTDRVDEVKHHCSSDVSKALYRLGYALHAV